MGAKTTLQDRPVNDDNSGDASRGLFVFVTVSEINTDSTSTPPKRFIELRSLRNLDQPLARNDKNLLGWRLLMIKGTTMDIVTSIDLSTHLPHHGSTYIVVGDSTVPKIDISLSNKKTEVAFTPETFPDLDESPYCFVVVWATDEYSASLLSLPQEGENYKPLSLVGDEERQRLVYTAAWDAVIIGRGAATNQCNFCTSLFPTRSFENGLKYLLRDRDSRSTSVNDYSLNHCCETFVPYSPSCFKLGHPSPGRENDCSGRRFILEYQMNSFSAARQPVVFVDRSEDDCPADFPGIEPYQYPLIHDHDYAQAVARVMSNRYCPAVENMEIDDDEGIRPGAVATTTVPEPPKKYVKPFDISSYNECRGYFTRPDELLRPMYSIWLDVKPNGDHCLIKCQICQKYFESGWRMDKKHRHYIQGKGYFSPRNSHNQKVVRDHLEDPIHVEAMYFYGQLESASSREQQLQIEALQREREKRLLKPTMNEVQLGYAEIRARTSFKNHGLFMETASELGVNVGTKHRHEKALEDIACTLSSCFHKRLLTRLVTEQPYFSLICDGTTSRQVAYLTCLMQTLENVNPIVYFWGLIVITTGETGYNMVEDVKIRVGDDEKIVPGFEEYFKSRIVASVSDSASNMAGIHNSFYAYLKRYVGRPIALVKCGAHKLQRAILHGLDFPTDEPSEDIDDKDRPRYFKEFLKINNAFYTFYMSRGSKRFQEFVELAEELDLHAYRIHYFFDVRWAASHKRCMETLYKNYDALRADLSRIVVDSAFEDSARSKATELYKHIIDKNFGITVAEFVDMLTSFEFMSERFQQKGGLMIANTEIVRAGYEDLIKVRDRTKKDTHLDKFLAKCSCADVCGKGQCTLEQYDECDEVIYDDSVSLTARTDGKHTIQLSKFRDQLYQNILSELVSYFEPELLEAFEVLNPKNFKTNCDMPEDQRPDRDCEALSQCYKAFPTIVPGTSPKTPEENFRRICAFYSVTDCESLLRDWKKLLASILQKSASIVSMEPDPAKFWPLQFQNTDITMSVDIKELLERVLVTSFTSSDAERAFSMVSKLQTPERTNLSPKTLEQLLRITFNGPPQLSEESLFEYTREFVKATSRVDDQTVTGGRPPNPEAYKSFFKSSSIF